MSLCSPSYFQDPSNFIASGFFGSRKKLNSYQGRVFSGAKGISTGSSCFNLISSAHLYRSNDFNINYSDPYSGYGSSLSSDAPETEETSLKIFLYKADNYID